MSRCLNRDRFRPFYRRVSLGVVGILTASTVATVGTPAVAAPDRLPKPRAEKVIPHTTVPLMRQPDAPPPAAGGREASGWPAAAEADVSLPRTVAPENSRQADLGAPTGEARPVGALPVLLSPGGAESIHVRVVDQPTAHRAGVTGVLMSLVPHNGSGTTTVAVDYHSFRNAGGANLGQRLHLVTLPACALTTPQLAGCQTQTPIPSTNDANRQLVSGTVPTDKSMVLAAVAGDSGPNGTFTASSLSPTGTWSVAGSSGEFTWSYPITVPAAATGTGIAPKIELGYSSSSVDGQTSGTNNQSSWIGEGWNYSPGFIERTYRSCANDESLPAEQQTGDLCWAGQIVTMNLGGQSIPLVYDDNNHTWHGTDDNGSRIELMTGAANGALNGEHWRVTTTDGVQYWFGRNRGPGYTNQEQTNSTWTVPVYGPHTNDPCHSAAGFAQSSCTQAWRWNLDFVEDPHGNAAAYYYAAETNFYGANNATTGVAYTRGGNLTRIDYGLRKINGSIYGQTTPRQVVFALTERCTPDATFSCDPALFTAANATHWPDTPQDQQCLAGATCNVHGPSFWSTKRLSTITTQYNLGAGPVRVDAYQLNQSFPPTTTDSDRELGLNSLVHTGYDPSGGSISLPPTTFTSQLLHNRVPGFNTQPAMAHWRMTNISTDTGSRINVSYSLPECAQGNMPTDPASNTKRCFPVYWTQPFQRDPTLDYFHKYVVTRVDVQDANGISPTQTTTYAYLGTPAWHFDDNEVVKPKHRTYGQYRGYGQVEVRTGDPALPADQRPLTRTTYLRGMGGNVTNSLGETTPDLNVFAGSARETQTFNGDGGPQLSTEVTDRTVVATTASRARTGLPALTANVVAVSRKRTLTALAAGGTRTTSTTSRYDSLGRIVASTDSGDGVPDLCTTTHYADNTASWIRDHVSETVTSQQVCPPDNVTPAPILADTRTYYDNSATLGDLPGAGDATRSDKATANASGTLTFVTMATTVYDAAGRPTSVTDALHRVIGTTYTPADGGLVSTVVSTNPKNQTTSVELEPSRGLTTATVDVGGHRSDATYDPLGRLTAVWQPGRSKANGDSANTTYAYLMRTDGPLAVTTKTLVDYGTGTNYLTSIKLYDALGQLRQTQADDVSNPDGVQNRIASDTFYDSHGWAVRGNNHYVTDGIPATTLIAVADSAVDDRTVSTFDGSGRPTVVTEYRGTTATWDTRTVYGGDRTTVFPPPGGVITTSVLDARGKPVEQRRYTSAPTVSGSVVSGGTFETSSYHNTALGQLDQLRDPAGNTWTYGYDFLGRQTSATDPDSGGRTSTFDLAGQLTSVTDARNQTLSYEYDPLGRKTAEWSGAVTTGTKLASWGYDDTRSLGKGLLTSTTRFTPGANYQLAFQYNGDGRLANQIVAIPSRETGLSGTYTTTYGYTTTGQLTRMDPVTLGGLPGERIAITYDRYGQPQATGGYNDYVDSTAYTSYGEPSQYRLGVNTSAGTLTFDRDSQTRLITQTNLSVQQAFPQVDDLRYTYDPAGNITRITNTQGSPANGAPTRTECFGYDALDRLSNAWTATDNCAAAPSTATVGGPTPYWTSWTFDQSGVRKTQVRHASGGDTTTTYNYPASGPNSVRPHAMTGTSTTGPGGTSTTAYTYNNAGDTIGRTLPAGNQTLTWTENNRISSITTPTGSTSYVYDGDGIQLLRRDPTSTTLYLPGEEITRDNATGVVTGTRYYTHNGTVVALRVGGANISWLQADQHGTTQVAVKAEAGDGHTVTRRNFDPYGNPLTTGTWPDTHGFLNKPHNPATGLTDIGARIYDPTIGTFQSVDPVLDTASPQQWTGYTYANNNPTTLSDPSGLHPICGLNHGDCGYEGEAWGSDPEWADEMDKWARLKAAQKKLSRPVTKNGKKMSHVQIASWRKNFGYNGSDDFTLADAYQWAMQGMVQMSIVCEVLQGSPDGCDEPSVSVWDIAKGAFRFIYELTPIADLQHCIDGSESCLWLLTDINPGGKLAKGLKIAKGAGDLAKDGNRLSDAAKAMCSFTGDTQVLMADGTHKPIAKVEVGDQVIAADPETGEQGPHTVLAVWAHQDTVVDLQLEDGSKVTTTENHPFYNLTDRAWERADQLEPGSRLSTTSGRVVRIVGLHPGTRPAMTAYNLTVANLHTYFVLAGNTPVLVHNDCNGDRWTSIGNLDEHFERHGREMGFETSAEYDYAARDLMCVCNGRREGVLIKRDGTTDYYFDPKSDEFGITGPRGIVTYYKADKRYFDSRPGVIVP